MRTKRERERGNERKRKVFTVIVVAKLFSEISFHNVVIEISYMSLLFINTLAYTHIYV